MDDLTDKQTRATLYELIGRALRQSPTQELPQQLTRLGFIRKMDQLGWDGDC